MHNNNVTYLRLRVIEQTDMSSLMCRARISESYVSFRTTYFYLIYARKRSAMFPLAEREENLMHNYFYNSLWKKMRK